MTRIDTVTEADVAGFWNTGPTTVADLIESGNVAISWHHSEARQLAKVVARDYWTRQVWRRDRRFTNLLPAVDATVYDIGVAGRHDHQRHLYRRLPAIRKRLDKLLGDSPTEALIRYVAMNTGRTRGRTVVLLQRVGLLEPALSGTEAALRLGVSQQRVHQLVEQLQHRVRRLQPPGERAWLPQHPDAIDLVLTPPRSISSRAIR
jgi:hypothetical protein